MSYEWGIKPDEFENMSLKQAGMYIEACTKRNDDHMKNLIIVGNGIAQQIVTGIQSMWNKKVKMYTLEDLYPGYFGKKKKKDISKMSKKQINDMSVLMWNQFLGLGGE